MEDFDVFGQLNNNALAKIKSSVKVMASKTTDLNCDIDFEALLAQHNAQKTASNRRPTKVKPRNPQSKLLKKTAKETNDAFNEFDEEPVPKGSREKRKSTNQQSKKSTKTLKEKNSAPIDLDNETCSISLPDSDSIEQANDSTANSTVIAPAPEVNRRRSSRLALTAAPEVAANVTIAATNASTSTTTKKGRRRQSSRNQVQQSVETVNLTDDQPAPVNSNSIDYNFANLTASIFQVPYVAPPQNQRDLRAANHCARQLRRRIVGEIAARAISVDYMDLISSPLPRIEGIVVVDSDEESDIPPATASTSAPIEKKVTNDDDDLENSFDEENPPISVKIHWHGKLEIFPMRKYQKFSHIFNKLADREQIAVENVALNLDDRIITVNDSPHSINYKIYQFISGRALASKLNYTDSMLPQKKKKDANQITLKVQSDKFKRPLEVDMLRSDQFKLLYIKCSEELNVPLNAIKLSFDGECLEYTGTPNELDMDGGEAIDLRYTA